MKKILLVVTCALLLLTFYSSVWTDDTTVLTKQDVPIVWTEGTNMSVEYDKPRVNTEGTHENIQIVKEKLATYQTIIDKINSEYGSSINIPESGIFEVYNNIKDIPLDQLEANLRRDYLMVKDGPSEVYIDTKKK